MSNLQGDWHSRVYAVSEEFDDKLDLEWRAMEKEVKRRDRNTCLSCGVKVGLSVHHILPRSEGGTNIPTNLITLCKYCHDEIEQLGLRDKWQIVDFKRKRKYIIGRKPETDSQETDWHKWVYGGHKKPST